MLMSKILTLVFLLSFFCFPVSAKEYGNIVVSEVTSIYDADTFTVNIESYPGIVGERISIRVLGVDAPEIRSKCKGENVIARQAKQFTF